MYGALLGIVSVFPYSLAMIEVCQVTMMVAWFCGSFCSPKFKFSPNSMVWALIAIALLIVLTIPFSHYPSLSLRKFFTRFLQQIFLMYLVTQTVHNRKRLFGVLTVLMATLFFVIIDVMVQYTWGKSIVHHTPLIFGRVSGPMSHPNDLATLLVTVLPITLALIIIYQRGRTKYSWVQAGLFTVLFLLLVNALGLTASRGAWVALVVSMIFFGVLLRNYKLVVLIALLMAFFFWGYGMHCLNTRIDMYSVAMQQGPQIHPSFSNIFGLPSNYNALELLLGPSGREFYWGTAVNVIKHYPWFGCGYSAYVQTLRDLHVGHEEYPHNSLLQITAELGFLGLILYGWFFTALGLQIKNIMRAVSSEGDLFLLGCGLSAGILAWAVHSFMDTAWTSLQLNVLWWLSIGILLSLRIIKGEKSAISP